MKKADELRNEYHREDLGRGVRGKYYREYMKGTNLVLLQPEVARAFPTSEAVNEASLSLIQVAKRFCEPNRAFYPAAPPASSSAPVNATLEVAKTRIAEPYERMALSPDLC